MHVERLPLALLPRGCPVKSFVRFLACLYVCSCRNTYFAPFLVEMDLIWRLLWTSLFQEHWAISRAVHSCASMFTCCRHSKIQLSQTLTFPCWQLFFPVFILLNFPKPGVVRDILYAVKSTLLNVQIVLTDSHVTTTMIIISMTAKVLLCLFVVNLMYPQRQANTGPFLSP